VAAPQSPRTLSVKVTFTLTAENGQTAQYVSTLKVLVPAGATTSGLAIEMQVPPLQGPALLTGAAGQLNNVGIGPAYDLFATNSRTGAPIHQFDPHHPLLLQMSYDPAQLDGIDPATLTVAYYNPGSKTWRSLPTTIDTYNHILTATTTHFTLFQVRGTARTKAQLKGAQARQAALAASGPPRVNVLPVAPLTLGGVPLIITVPSGSQRPPLAVEVTGPPYAQMEVTYAIGGTSIVQVLHLDAHGYAITAFVPGDPLTKPQMVRVSVTVTSGAAHKTAVQTVILLPNQVAGRTPPGAPALRATLSASHVRAGAQSPLLAVRTAPGAAVRALLMLAGRPSVSAGAVAGKANQRGALSLRLPSIPRALVVSHTRGKAKTVTVQVVVTVSLRGASTRQALPLTVSR
jgi:hypothetical protein